MEAIDWVVIAGYFIAQWAMSGVGAALVEVPVNAVQELIGLLGVQLYLLVADAYPPILRWAQRD